MTRIKNMVIIDASKSSIDINLSDVEFMSPNKKAVLKETFAETTGFVESVINKEIVIVGGRVPIVYREVCLEKIDPKSEVSIIEDKSGKYYEAVKITDLDSRDIWSREIEAKPSVESELEEPIKKISK